MTNLFSVFDPTWSIFNLSLNWMSTLLGLMVIPSTYWLMPSRYQFFWNSILLTLHKDFKILLGSTGHSLSTFIFFSLLSLILYNNYSIIPLYFYKYKSLSINFNISFTLMIMFYNLWLN